MIETVHCPKCHVVSWERAVGAHLHARGWIRGQDDPAGWTTVTQLIEWMKSEGFADLGSCDGFIKRCQEHAEAKP